MRALVVYESMFGNTAALADHVAAGLADSLVVELVEVGAAAPVLPDEPGGRPDLLVLGAPTHAFGLSTAGTRRAATDRSAEPLVSGRIGLREWLDGERPDLAGLATATFDTRIERPRLPGSAARVLRRRLLRHGCRPIVEPQSFYVTTTTGPLSAGEVTRARQWGRALAAAVPAAAQPA
jgi:hypothetical protein